MNLLNLTTLKLFISRLKWINGLGFLICLSSFVFWFEINQFFTSLSFIYEPDNGQYIIMYIGLLLGLYGINEPVVKLFCFLFSANLIDETFNHYTKIDWHSFKNNLQLIFDIMLIFVLSIYNYKNVRNECK